MAKPVTKAQPALGLALPKKSYKGTSEGLLWPEQQGALKQNPTAGQWLCRNGATSLASPGSLWKKVSAGQQAVEPFLQWTGRSFSELQLTPTREVNDKQHLKANLSSAQTRMPDLVNLTTKSGPPDGALPAFSKLETVRFSPQWTHRTQNTKAKL